VKLNHITLAVSDLTRSRDFYTRLGLRLIVLDEPRYARFHVPGNDSTLSIEVMPSVALPAIGQCHLYFECDDIERVYSDLCMAGFDFVQPPTDMEYLWKEARLRDPDGHDVRLFSAGRNRLYPPWRIWWS
jgi:catechol 2,3-dioxygenase-like lactoylglutathione lyase family enzyme